jgi:hypothetical protein
MKRALLITALMSGMLASGCSTAKREAASLVSQVDRYRRAENVTKTAEAGVLETVTCTDRDVCEAKDACVKTSRPTGRGLALKSEVEAALADLGAGKLTREQAGAQSLPGKLEEAQRLLDEGRAALPACDAKVMALRLKYSL